MNVIDLPEFAVIGNDRKHYLIKATDRHIAAWEKTALNEYQSVILTPDRVEGGKAKLMELAVWETFEPAVKNRIETNPTPVAEKVEKPIVMITNAEGVMVKRGRGRPRKIPVAVVEGAVPVAETPKAPKAPKAVKAIVYIRLADGTVRARTKGRQPRGSVVVEGSVMPTPQETVMPPTVDGVPVPPVQKIEKPVVMIRLLDGTVRARTRGRQPAGSVVVK